MRATIAGLLLAGGVAAAQPAPDYEHEPFDEQRVFTGLHAMLGIIIFLVKAANLFLKPIRHLFASFGS